MTSPPPLRPTGVPANAADLVASPYGGIAAVVVLVVIAALRLSTGMDKPLTGDALRYASVAQRMLESGDWTEPVNGGRPYFAKPPLLMWAIAGSLRVFGTSPEAAALPSIVAGVGVIVAVFLLVRRHGGDVAGWVAALGLVSLPSYVNNTVTARLESSLLLTSLGALWAFERARTRPAMFAAGWAFLGVGLLVKGAPGLMPLPVLAVAALLLRDPRPFLSKGFWLASPVAVLVAGPWFLHMTLSHGDVFWQGAFGKEVVHRFEREGASALPLLRDSLEYPSYLTPPALGGAWLAWRDGRTRPGLRRATGLAIAWILVLLAGQAANPRGFSRYMYATLPAFAGLTGYAVVRLVGGRAKPKVILAVAAVAAVLFLALRIAGVREAAARRGDSEHHRVLAALDRVLPEGPVLAIVGEPTGAANFVGFHRRRSVRTVSADRVADVLPAPGSPPVHALVDDRVPEDVLRAAGAVDVAHGPDYSVVRLEARAR